MELKDLKVGDEVFYSNGSVYSSGAIIEITRITDTMIICNNTKFRKDNGNLVGNASEYILPRIKVLIEELKKQVYKQRYIRKIDNFNFGKLTYEELKELYEMIVKKNEFKKNGDEMNEI